MLKGVLYLIASALETGLGIWAFSQMFPKRNKMGKKQFFSEWCFFTFAMSGAYSFPKFFFGLEHEEQYKGCLVIIYFILLGSYIIYKIRQKVVSIESKVVEIIFYVGMVMWIACQYWDSYQSDIATILGNILPVLFIFVFYECTLSQAYLWEIAFLTNIGLMRVIYITYMGVFKDKYYEEYFIYPRPHTYGEIIYWFGICIAFFS